MTKVSILKAFKLYTPSFIFRLMRPEAAASFVKGTKGGRLTELTQVDAEATIHAEKTFSLWYFCYAVRECPRNTTLSRSRSFVPGIARRRAASAERLSAFRPPRCTGRAIVYTQRYRARVQALCAPYPRPFGIAPPANKPTPACPDTRDCFAPRPPSTPY